MSKNVTVLLGGWSAEREVSLVSGAACVNALKEAGYDVTPIDVHPDMGALLTRLYPKPDAVFNALHGRYGEDGCVQGLLDILGIPYTHSGLMASALAMDKPMAKHLFKTAGLLVAKHVEASADDIFAADLIPRPYVIKPSNEGSSVGVQIIKVGGHNPIIDAAMAGGTRMMVEAFIDGRELTVAVMNGKALAVTEIITHHDFYDYGAKYENGGSTHHIPAEIGEDLNSKAMGMAERAYSVLGCRGVARVDFRFDGENLFILEVNTQPGMTPTSLVPEQAAHVGISFPDLVSWMVEKAEFDQ
tara:strand:+ start:3267 stop:4169 length:903 start_codon:yes stop_codon:yes gene_type:complete